MIKNTIDSNEKININDKEIAVLKEHFPSCFKKDGSFDIEKFSKQLKDKVDVISEGYELNFLGKSYAKLLASIDTTTVIKPDLEHNEKEENKNSENVYISGDNLDALKHLLKSYSGMVKCTYIDPPYNTGSDGFVYNDKFNFTVEELMERLSLDEGQAQRIIDMTNRGSASHSAWLTFMYPRLLLAKDLLREDGVIFISIDDNEQENLKLLCDDVFGEENFIAKLVWQKRKGGGNDSYFVAVDHEYVLVYTRNASKEIQNKKWRVNYTEEYLKRYSETDENGDRFYWDTLSRDGLKNPIVIEYKAPDGSIVKLNSQKNEETIKTGLKEGTIRLVKGKNGWTFHHRVYMPAGKVMRSILLDVGTNKDSNDELLDLFEEEIFDYAKPTTLIAKLIELIPDNNQAIIVDFFSGSGTTAETVMRLNQKDNGKRKFITVQLPEDLDKKLEKSGGNDRTKIQRIIGFLDSVNRTHTLNQIGIERIKRAAKKIKEETNSDIDYGFKHYELLEPNQNTLDKLESFDPNAYLVDKTILDEFGSATILSTWAVKDGYGFNPPMEVIDLEGYTAYLCEKHLYMINPDIKDISITKLIEKFEEEGDFNPENIVLFGYSFISWSLTQMLENNIKQLNNSEKNLKVNVITRY